VHCETVGIDVRTRTYDTQRHRAHHHDSRVAAARETNRSLTAQGRVTIALASVSALPYSGSVFDLVTCLMMAETVVGRTFRSGALP
jgi:hypothetical protein